MKYKTPLILATLTMVSSSIFMTPLAFADEPEFKNSQENNIATQSDFVDTDSDLTSLEEQSGGVETGDLLAEVQSNTDPGTEDNYDTDGIVSVGAEEEEEVKPVSESATPMVYSSRAALKNYGNGDFQMTRTDLAKIANDIWRSRGGKNTLILSKEYNEVAYDFSKDVSKTPNNDMQHYCAFAQNSNAVSNQIKPKFPKIVTNDNRSLIHRAINTIVTSKPEMLQNAKYIGFARVYRTDPMSQFDGMDETELFVLIGYPTPWGKEVHPMGSKDTTPWPSPESLKNQMCEYCIWDPMLDVTTPPSTGNPAPQNKLKVERNSGKDRYATSYAVAKSTMVANKPVFVATGASYPDALTAGAAAASLGGSLVLTSPKALSPEMLNLIKSKKPNQIYVIGGPAVVSNNVVNQLKTSGSTVTRIYGKTRYETSNKIAKWFFGSYTAYVATGKDFPDALAVSGKAGREGSPIILFDGKTAAVPAQARNVILVGGKGVISEQYANQLRKSGKNVSRYGGKDRFATAQQIQSNNAKTVWVANGMGFADALSAAAASGRDGNTLILSKQTCIPAGAKKAIGSNTANVHIVGGTGVLSNNVFNLKQC